MMVMMMMMMMIMIKENNEIEVGGFRGEKIHGKVRRDDAR